MFLRYVVGIGLAFGLVAGCSEPPYQLPDRSLPAVRAEEERLAAFLPDKVLWGPGACKVRLLGQEGSSSFAWVTCEITPTAGGPSGGVSMPVRVDGDQVRTPTDGAGYAGSITAMFPPRLAEVVIHEAERLRP